MRKFIFLIIAFGVIFLIFILFLLLEIFGSKTPTGNTSVPIPTNIPVTDNSTSSNLPPIKYDFNKANQLANTAKNRQTLSANGSTEKQKLIASLNNTSGSVYSSPNIRIGYIAAPDLFQAEIISSNIDSAKKEAVSWMLSQGFTRDDLCKLPFSFYLGAAPAATLINTGVVFNPLPEGC